MRPKAITEALPKCRWFGAVVCAFPLALGCGSAEPASGNDQPIAELSEPVGRAHRFGSWCQDGQYEVDPVTGQPWLPATGKRMCENFDFAMLELADKEFNKDLKGTAKVNWESTSDHLSMERVDIAFANVHGGGGNNYPNYATFGLWKNGLADASAMVWSTRMRLGEETSTQRGLSILATYACDTMSIDANTWTRWINPFRGGLRMVLGSHGSPVSPFDGEHLGTVFRNHLRMGWTLFEAWMGAMNGVHPDNPSIAFATGNSPEECASRRDNMRWGNYKNYPRRKDAAVQRICWRYWN